MATVQNFNISPDEKQPDATSSPQPLGGGGGQSQSQQPSQSAQATQPKGTSSGRFTNLNQYLQANQGFNQQGGGLAGKVTSNIQGQVSNAQNQFGQAQQDFQNQANSNRVQYDPNLVQQATQNASQFVQDPNQVSSFQKLRDASYGGPTALNDASIAQSAGNLQNLAQLGQTESGRPQLLKQLYSNPNYTMGQQSLDNLLLQANPDQLASLQTLNPLTANLSSSIASGEQAASAQAKQYGQEASDTQNQTRQALMNAASGIDTGLQQKAQQTAQDQQATFNRLQQEIQSGKISSGDLSMLGLKPEDVSSLYGLGTKGLLQDLSVSPTATKQSIAGSNDVAQLNALAQLSGSAVPNVGALAQDYQNGVGTYKGPVNFNADAFKGQLAAAQAEAQGKLSPTEQYLKEAQTTQGQRKAILDFANQYSQGLSSPTALGNANAKQSLATVLTNNPIISQIQSLYGPQALSQIGAQQVGTIGEQFDPTKLLQMAQNGVGNINDIVGQRQSAFDALKQKLGYGQGLQVV